MRYSPTRSRENKLPHTARPKPMFVGPDIARIGKLSRGIGKILSGGKRIRPCITANVIKCHPNKIENLPAATNPPRQQNRQPPRDPRKWQPTPQDIRSILRGTHLRFNRRQGGFDGRGHSACQIACLRFRRQGSQFTAPKLRQSGQAATRACDNEGRDSARECIHYLAQARVI